ncbi:MAG: LytTR family DNA-binding domain-containing protein [Cytophagales bacterium]|nr:LytTR family DNA-binding domain-containing protein [Cytophagales bacterium]
MINAVALDDEPLALCILKDYVQDIPSLVLSATFTQPSKAIAYIQHQKCDLIFLDIQMPDVLGTNFAKYLPKDMMIIFTTAHSQYAAEGFNMQAIDYLLKPFDKSRFEQAIHKANEYQTYIRSHRQPDCLFVYSEYSLIKINLLEIVYIESYGDYVKIHLIGKKVVLTLMTMKQIVSKLPSKMFARIHRSYIVAISKINEVRAKNIILEDGIQLTVGASYKDLSNIISL